MERDVMGFHIDNKPSTINVRLNGTEHDPILVSPRAVPEKIEAKDHELDDRAVKGKFPDELNQKQDVSKEKIIRAETQSNDKTLSFPVNPESGSADNSTTDANSSEPVTPATENEEQSSFTDYANGAETNDSGAIYSPHGDGLHSPNAINKSQPTSPSMLAKQHSQDKKFYDDEDQWSMASSNATSVRTNKSGVTVPVAPKFTVDDRLERRKEYYAKLEEKHQALDKERTEYQARIKEEETAAIKQLRKSMVVKANPVPNFYHEGPPPKPELKKLPVTRAKSPNLTRGSARRKSCSDAVMASPEDKELNRCATRHSIDVYREGKNSLVTSQGKDRIGAKKWNDASKDKAKTRPKEPKETSKVEKALC